MLSRLLHLLKPPGIFLYMTMIWQTQLAGMVCEAHLKEVSASHPGSLMPDGRRGWLRPEARLFSKGTSSVCPSMAWHQCQVRGTGRKRVVMVLHGPCVCKQPERGSEMALQVSQDPAGFTAACAQAHEDAGSDAEHSLNGFSTHR